METDIAGLSQAAIQTLINAAVSAALPPATQLAVSRPLNSAFLISNAHDSVVSYSVQVTTTASIGSGQDGDVVLEIATDSAMSLNLQTVAIVGSSQTFALAVALQGVQKVTGVLSGVVPQGMWARLRTVNNTGTPTFSVRAGQETAI